MVRQTAKKRPGLIRENRQDRIFLGIVLAVSVLILIIELYPLIFVVSASFSDSDAEEKNSPQLVCPALKEM